METVALPVWAFAAMAGVLGGVVGFALWLLLEWLRSRLAARRTPPYEGDECEVCGHRGHDNITLGSVTKRPEFGGSSGITATFCPQHLPDEKGRVAVNLGGDHAAEVARRKGLTPYIKRGRGNPWT